MTLASITDPMRLAGLLPSLIPTSASLLAVSRAGRTEHQCGSTSPDCAATYRATCQFETLADTGRIEPVVTNTTNPLGMPVTAR